MEGPFMMLNVQSIQERATRFQTIPWLSPVSDIPLGDNGKPREIASMSRLIEDAKTAADVPDADVERFVQLYEHCIAHKRLEFGQLCEMVALPLAFDRILLVLYSFSRYSREELNQWMGGEIFIPEAGLVRAVPWPWVQRDYSRLEHGVWEAVFGAAPSAPDPDVRIIATKLESIACQMRHPEGRKQVLALLQDVRQRLGLAPGERRGRGGHGD
jgi:hypothetical protein